MANYVVFIDLEHAKVMEMHPDRIEEHKFHRHEIRHHNGSEKEQNHHKNSEKFFHQVAASLKSANEFLLIGPGVAKTHFKEHLEKHDPMLAKKLAGTETVDHPTDNQIVALAKRFFKAHSQLESNTPR